MTRPRRAGEVVPGLGARLRILRQARSMTQERLGELANIQSETMSRIENGANTPDLDTLARIAKVLGVPIPTLFPVERVVDDPHPALTESMLSLWEKLGEEDRKLVIAIVGRITTT